MLEAELDVLRATAARWRDLNPGHDEGVVLLWDGQVYGWKDRIRDPGHERPGAIAVSCAGEVLVAAGGDDVDGAAVWSVVAAGSPA